MSAKQAINDKLQGSVATYLRCGGVVNNQIKKRLLLSLWVKKIKSVNIWHSYKQERDCFLHFFRLLTVRSPSAQRKRLSFAEAGGFHVLSESGRIFCIKCRPKMTALHLLNWVGCLVIKLKSRYWINCSPLIKMTALWFLNWVMELFMKSVSCSVFISQVSVVADRPARHIVCTIL